MEKIQNLLHTERLARSKRYRKLSKDEQAMYSPKHDYIEYLEKIKESCLSFVPCTISKKAFRKALEIVPKYGRQYYHMIRRMYQFQNIAVYDKVQKVVESLMNMFCFLEKLEKLYSQSRLK